ncbi:MAG: glycosyltransferase [Candidatus Omnitrophica bacterium]|nr:glycosyltransferase [Candidatus Omnitrophota bacterium]
MAYKPLVSVIITSYNRRAFLKEAVESVRAQNYAPLEIVVVDDGSDDGTGSDYTHRTDLKYIRLEGADFASAEKRYPRLPKSFGARGVSAARNAGIRSSTGELIALLDSDDFWKPEKIETQVRYFEENSGAMICQTEEIWIRNGRRVNPRQVHKKFSGEIFNPCLPRCVISPSAVMFKRSLLDRVGVFDETFPVCEDYELWLRVSAKYPVGLIPAPLTVKRGGHSDQLSRQHSLDFYRIRALEKILRQSMLTESQRVAVLGELEKKSAIYAKGCLKHGHLNYA